MKTLLWVIAIIIVIGGLFYAFKGTTETPIGTTPTPVSVPVVVTPITHATAILSWAGSTIYTDPTGSTTPFAGRPSPDIIIVTDIHGDHLSTTTTLLALVGSSTSLIVPQAVENLLPASLASSSKVLANDQTITEKGFSITAVPMYNLPTPGTTTPVRHTKGRGNGYIIERDGYRVYIAGDTAGTPEMRALTDIDIAFVPMNLPFTMGVDEAADAVLDFKPARVYPYHYRGQDGLADVDRFKQLVNAGDPNIEVVLLNWYSASN